MQTQHIPKNSFESNSKNKYSPSQNLSSNDIKISNVRHDKHSKNKDKKKKANGLKSQPQCHVAHDFPSFHGDAFICCENLNGKNILILIKAFRC